MAGTQSSNGAGKAREQTATLHGIQKARKGVAITVTANHGARREEGSTRGGEEGDEEALPKREKA